MRLLLVVFLPLALYADPITVTTLNQTLQATAEATAYAGQCNISSTTNAVCNAGNEQTGMAYADASTTGGPDGGLTATGLYVAASATSPNFGHGSADASISGTALITGGNGTGYMNIVYEYSAISPYTSDTVKFNDQQLQPNTWQTVAFTFGQPFEYSLSLETVSDTNDNGSIASLYLFAVDIYTSQPTEPAGPGCAGPSRPCPLLSVPELFMGVGTSASSVPEPASATLAALGLFALVRGRRWWTR